MLAKVPQQKQNDKVSDNKKKSHTNNKSNYNRENANSFYSYNNPSLLNSTQDDNQFSQKSIHSKIHFNFANIQTKLKVNQPGDEYEQEADRVAEQVISNSSINYLFYSTTSKPTLNENDSIISKPQESISQNIQKKEEDKVKIEDKYNQEEQNKLKISRKSSDTFTQETTVLSADSLSNINSVINESGKQLDSETRGFMESRFGYDFGDVRIHADSDLSKKSADSMNALAYTIGNDIVFKDEYNQINSKNGQKLLTHELTHIVQQNKYGNSSFSKTIQRRISPEDISSEEMVDRRFQIITGFTSGLIQLSGGEEVIVVRWSNTLSTAEVKLPAPYLHSDTPFNIPKILLRPISVITPGIAPYGTGFGRVIGDIRHGEQAIATENLRRGGPRSREIARLERLQQTRQRLFNRRLIQETMFNRFDPIIRNWTDYYNRQFPFPEPLDPNLVKSILFQESQLGTSGEHLEVPPSHPVKTRFNLGQVIDSSAAALLIMINEMDPNLLSIYHLTNIHADLVADQRELENLRRIRNRDAIQQTRFNKLIQLSHPGGTWENFLWEYKAIGQTVGFAAAANDFFIRVGGGHPANFDYEFWIRTAIHWLFQKRRSVRNWEDTIRAYNGSGERARHYREAVVRRARSAEDAQNSSQDFIPSNI